MVVRAALRFGFGTASLLAGSWLLRALHGAPAALGASPAGSTLTNAPSRKFGERRATSLDLGGRGPQRGGRAVQRAQHPASGQRDAVPNPKRSAARTTIRRPGTVRRPLLDARHLGLDDVLS